MQQKTIKLALGLALAMGLNAAAQAQRVTPAQAVKVKAFDLQASRADRWAMLNNQDVIRCDIVLRGAHVKQEYGAFSVKDTNTNTLFKVSEPKEFFRVLQECRKA